MILMKVWCTVHRAASCQHGFDSLWRIIVIQVLGCVPQGVQERLLIWVVVHLHSFDRAFHLLPIDCWKAESRGQIPEMTQHFARLVSTRKASNPRETGTKHTHTYTCLLYTSPSPRD